MQGRLGQNKGSQGLHNAEERKRKADEGDIQDIQGAEKKVKMSAGIDGDDMKNSPPQEDYPLISFLSQLSLTHVSDLTFTPSPLLVVLHAQTKHVLPALLASTHDPLPEHELVWFMQTSAVEKHVEIEPIGSCGDGW
jgi:hypothetical protein